MKFSYKKNNNDTGIINDILLRPRKDRRLLSNVPDKERIRKGIDRRGQKILDESVSDSNAFIDGNKAGIRYLMQTDIKIRCKSSKGNLTFITKSIDISTTGMLIELQDKKQLDIINEADKVKLQFKILPGSMPEGYEMKVNIDAKKVRNTIDESGKILCGIEFLETLSEYSNRKKDKYFLLTSSLILFFISLFIILMRAESIIYFKFNKWLYLYSIIAAVFLLSRYLFGALYKPVPIDTSYTPGVTIIIPCFNEEEWIQRTILSCINQDYLLIS